MLTFKEFWDSKANVQQVNQYLQGLNKMLSKGEILKHLKKHFDLKKIRMNPAFTKVLAVEENDRIIQ